MVKPWNAALTWFEIAAGMGDPQARENRDRYAETVSLETRHRARQRARAFRPVNSAQDGAN